MPTQVETVLRSATRKDGDPLNILCAATHERQQSAFGSMKHRFYMFNHPSFKEWKTKYAPIPPNHVMLNRERGNNQLPPWVDFDVVISQNKFGQYQILSAIAKQLRLPLISVEHTLPPTDWARSRVEECRRMMGDIDVFVSEYQRIAWGYPEDHGFINHTGIDTMVFKPLSEAERIKKENTCLSVVNDWVNRDWCMLADTQILTSNGYTAIADISIGDKVLTDSGQSHEVIETFERDYDGQLIEIELTSGHQIAFTPEHSIRVFRPNKNMQWKYLPAKNLKTGDVLRFPKHIQTDFTINDESFAWLIGLIIGDGHITKHGSIQISINKNDYEWIEQIKEIFKSITKSKVSVSKRQLDKGIYLVECSSKILGNWLRSKIYNTTDDKQIPEFIMSSSDEIRLSCLKGLFFADGTFKNGNRCDRFVLSTISYTLASQASSILHSLDVKCSINTENRTTNKKPKQSTIYRVVGYGKQNVQICYNILYTPYDDWFENQPTGYQYTINHTRKFDYKGHVYNCRVVNNPSYVVYPGFVAHNCCGFSTWQQITGYPQEGGLPVRIVGDTPGLSLPAQDIDELVRHYNSARLYLNTTTVSSLPTVILEAMACGLPVVSTATCLIPKIIIEHGKNGYVSNDVNELRSYCNRLLQDESLAREIGEAGRQTVLEKFSMNRFVDTWDEILQHAVRIKK
jgi:hypothetical protein